jgi:deoxyhypusine synthase
MSDSLFKNASDIIPQKVIKTMSVTQLVDLMGQLSFEARLVHRGAQLLKKMVDENDTIWLGIAGAGIAGGMGGLVISLIENGFIDAICSTGAQVYHDLHFAYGLPVKAIHPSCNDDLLRQHGDTRIYDIGIREKETLEEQDKIIREFIKAKYPCFGDRPIASWVFNYELGKWVNENALYPERSFVATASSAGVPIFWDSHTNHSIAMNMLKTDHEGFPIRLSAQKDIFDSAAITYSSSCSGFFELGGGGPKNFIQQTGPTLSQILSVDYQGAERGIQIGTAIEREGSLSGCTFGEAVTWGKYQTDDPSNLVQIWGEYSLIFPLIVAYIIDQSPSRQQKNLVHRIPEFIEKLKETISR